MYGLDINFLKDREIRPVETQGGGGQAAAPGDRTPLFIGLVVAVAALGLVGGYWLWLQRQVEQLEAERRELDDKLTEIRGEVQEIENIRAQTEIVRSENQAFVNVFNRIRPWSALMQELRNRVPKRVQIEEVSQTAGQTPPNNPDAEPPAAGGIQISGVACSFNDVNDFMLVLQRSPMLSGPSVEITQAEKRNELLDPEVDGTCPGSPENTPVFLVDYTIEANLTNIPASDLLEVLDRQGAVGLATRIRALRDSGVIDAQ